MAASFAATTDAQWDQMIKEAREDVAAGRAYPLDAAFPVAEES